MYTFLTPSDIELQKDEIMYTFLTPSGTELLELILCMCSLHLPAPSGRSLNYVHVPHIFWHRVAEGEIMYTFLTPSGPELQELILCIHSLHLPVPSCSR